MITVPVGVWIAFNALICMMILAGKSSNKALAFSMGFGISLITSAALAAGLMAAFLAVELGLWALQMLVAVLAASVRPPGKDVNGDVGSLAISATIRLAIAMGVWFCS